MPKNIFSSQNNYKHNITIQQYQYVVLFSNNLDWHIHTTYVLIYMTAIQEHMTTIANTIQCALQC